MISRFFLSKSDCNEIAVTVSHSLQIKLKSLDFTTPHVRQIIFLKILLDCEIVCLHFTTIFREFMDCQNGDEFSKWSIFGVTVSCYCRKCCTVCGYFTLTVYVLQYKYINSRTRNVHLNQGFSL